MLGVVLLAALALPLVAADGGQSSGDSAWLERRFLQMYAPNETRLLWQIDGWGSGSKAAAAGGGGAGSGSAVESSSRENACGGGPFLLTRTAAPNGACSPRFTRFNASCTCLGGVSGADVNGSAITQLSVRVQLKPTDSDDTAVSTSTPANGVLRVSSIGSFGVPASLATLSIVGELEGSLAALAIPLGSASRWGSSAEQTLIQCAEDTHLVDVTLANLDLRNFTVSDNFFPPTLKNLTLRNCGVSSLASPFFGNLAALERLDLSSNALSEPYKRPQIARCASGNCPLTSLNLSNNNFTTLPATAAFYASLTELDLSGNAISNRTVSQDVYDSIAQLSSFLVSASSSEDCSSPTSKMTVHDVDLCVSVSAAASTPATTSGSDTKSFLVYGMLGGCVVVAVLMFVLVKQRKERDRSKHTEQLLLNFTTLGHTDATPPFGDSAFDTGAIASLLNDPIILTHRIQQREIHVANCVSKGGFGIVYSGVYLRRRVAIKKMRPEYATNAKMVETFLREICLMATLEHARIVEFLGVAWESPRDIFAVTEFMDRGDLRDVFEHQHRKNTSLVTWANGKKTRVALHVAEALQYMHALSPKIIHRDLKAKNVLMSDALEAKLSDFGISRERHEEETHMTAAVGTSFWIAPEVLLGQQDYDERADIYSFGVLLCEIDTEDYPFWIKDHPDRGNKAREQDILRGVAMGSLRPGFSEACPGEILELAERCLDGEPANRPTAREMVALLEGLLRK